MVRVQEQVPLDALDHVEQAEERRAEDENRLPVALPVLLSTGAGDGTGTRRLIETTDFGRTWHVVHRWP